MFCSTLVSYEIQQFNQWKSTHQTSKKKKKKKKKKKYFYDSKHLTILKQKSNFHFPFLNIDDSSKTFSHKI